MKKITIKDIARLSGVSIATVSYVINDRKDQKISEATRHKINQIVNLYNFKPNTNAQNLNSSKNKSIAICSSLSSFCSNADFKVFLDKLTILLSDNNYSLTYLPSTISQISNQLDAVIVLNSSRDFFRKISDQCFCPVIAVDCNIDDPLFYQINLDFNKLKKLADQKFKKDYTFVYYKFNDLYLNKLIETTFDSFLSISSISDLISLDNLNTDNIVTINLSIQEYLMQKNKCVCLENLNTDDKFKLILSSLNKAIKREEDQEHKLYY